MQPDSNFDGVVIGSIQGISFHPFFKEGSCLILELCNCRSLPHQP
jgi:hypothetical protein